MLEKSLTMHADNVTYDLEDSVAPSLKASARTNLRSLLSKPRPAGVKEMCVRINSVDTGLALDDLTEVLQGEYLDAIMLPKCESAADLHFVTDVIRHLSPTRHPSSPHNTNTGKKPLSIIALIESAKAIQNLKEICEASPYLDGSASLPADLSRLIGSVNTGDVSNLAATALLAQQLKAGAGDSDAATSAANPAPANTRMPWL